MGWVDGVIDVADVADIIAMTIGLIFILPLVVIKNTIRVLRT